MKGDAIVTDAANAVDTQQQADLPVFKMPEADAYDRIAEQFEQNRDELNGDAEPKQAQNNVIDVESQLDAVNVIDDPTKYNVKVKMEGQEQELNLKDVLAGYQKNEVASRRMTEATRMKQEAERLLAEAQAKAEEAKKVTPAKAPDDVKTTAKEFMTSFLEGDEDAAVEALAKLTAGREQATQAVNVDTSTIASEVKEEVKQQLEAESALAEFSSSYADVLADPYLAELTNKNLAHEMGKGTHDDYASALKAAGDATRDWMKKLGVANANKSSTTPQNERVARKQAAEQLPNLSASAGQNRDADETVEDIIQEMKRTRGFVT